MGKSELDPNKKSPFILPDEAYASPELIEIINLLSMQDVARDIKRKAKEKLGRVKDQVDSDNSSPKRQALSAEVTIIGGDAHDALDKIETALQVEALDEINNKDTT